MIIFNKIHEHFTDNKPFVAYSKPNESKLSAFFMQSDTLRITENFEVSGFVFAPFDEVEDAILFPKEESEFYQKDIDFDDLLIESESVLCDQEDLLAKEKHIKIVNKAIDTIENSDLEKIVISRNEIVDLENFDLLRVYKSLLKKYQNAFVYVWFHPKVGLWLGATPETLLHVEGDKFKTMSLAGTQVYQENKNHEWKSKELEEQQLVTYFIESQLNPISSNLKIDATETIRAGNLLHLRTRVEGRLSTNANLEQLIRAIHPTPAVCGLPRKSAKDFILNNEGYNRTFYTGFLGELNLKNTTNSIQKSQLFVNLRCMSIKDNSAVIYVGGGITKDSVAEKEYEETVSKSKTMKTVL